MARRQAGYRVEMETMTCPGCQGPMEPRDVAETRVHRCGSCGGIFLARTDLGGLVEAESDWHQRRSAVTRSMPRISESMDPPIPPKRRNRAFIEKLFNA